MSARPCRRASACSTGGGGAPCWATHRWDTTRQVWRRARRTWLARRSRTAARMGRELPPGSQTTTLHTSCEAECRQGVSCVCRTVSCKSWRAQVDDSSRILQICIDMMLQNFDTLSCGYFSIVLMWSMTAGAELHHRLVHVRRRTRMFTQRPASQSDDAVQCEMSNNWYEDVQYSSHRDAMLMPAGPP